MSSSRKISSAESLKKSNEYGLSDTLFSPTDIFGMPTIRKAYDTRRGKPGNLTARPCLMTAVPNLSAKGVTEVMQSFANKREKLTLESG